MRAVIVAERFFPKQEGPGLNPATSYYDKEFLTVEKQKEVNKKRPEIVPFESYNNYYVSFGLNSDTGQNFVLAN